MGESKSASCNEITKIIWEFAQTRNIWLSVSYIPGKLNIIADNQSRKFSAELEWKLNSHVFVQITAVLSRLSFKCDIDLFASRLHFQISPYVSYRPDPDAYAVDAFTLTWSSFTFYAFPPFSIIPQVLQKVSQDRATGLLIIPFWPSQAFFPSVLHMLISNPIFIHRKKTLLQLPAYPKMTHPLHRKLNLLVCCISGNPSLPKTYQKQLKTSSCTPGGKTQESNTLATSVNGQNFVVNGRQILFLHL